ncbi:MlaD family protein [Aestuariispira insulae]|uniref:Phospholipid/cholesterol/gamma-HCH transport system substrate-binding protein n=1 Tax=Aestuariispira insulae TaxID=1461337 RepID=A0A3D9HJR8_9PROT|nr:MlaD family protein [Aestuariispira insulae]RED49166.1 phospholipid/cholesterol/gamma-HCH transport system substrate-binding protein [Aestuariispira insulae]
METKASYILVGSFVLGCLVTLVAAIIWLSGSELDQKSAFYDILFEGSVTGLKEGNPVRYRGVPVGVVHDIGINKDNVEQVRVTIEIQSDTPIKEDASASMEFQGLTGVGYVQISGGTHDAPDLKAGKGEKYPVIQATSSQLQEVFDQAPELINRFIALVDRANLLLNPANQENIAKTLENVSAFSGALAEGSGEMKQLLADARKLTAEMNETLLRVRPILENADSTMRDISTLTAELRPEVGPTARKARVTMDEMVEVARQMRQVAENMDAAAKSITYAATEAGDILSDNREQVDHFTNAGLYEFTQLMAETRLLVSNLTHLSAEIERDPARFFFGDNQQGYDLE